MVLERSTGTSTSIFGVGFGLTAAAGAGDFFEGRILAVGCDEVFVLRMLSMEKLRFLAGWEAAGGLIISEAASSRSVGVLGGEASDEKLVDIIDLGDDDGRDDLGEAVEEAGESLTLMMGDDVSLLPSSVLIW